jgi:integrase
MTRATGEGTVYQIKTGRQAGMWRAELVVGWAGARKVTKTRTVRTEAEARRKLRELANERDESVPTNRTGREQIRFGAWCDRWLAAHTKRKGVEPSTRQGYETVIRSWIKPRIGQQRLDRLSPGHIRAVLADMSHLTSSPRQAWIVMHAACDYAVRERQIARNPCDQVDPPVQARPVIEAPTGEDVEAIYAAIIDSPHEARWIIALTLGLRQGEALGLEWASVDLAGLTVTIRQQLVRVRGRHGCGDPTPLGGHKGNAWPCGHKWASKCPTGQAGGLALKPVKTRSGNRTVPIAPFLVPMLERIAEQQRRDAMTERGYRLSRMRIGSRERAADLVFRTRLGAPIDPRADSAAWHAVLVSAGLAPACTTPGTPPPYRCSTPASPCTGSRTFWATRPPRSARRRTGTGRRKPRTPPANS